MGGCGSQVWEKPIREVRERGMFVLWASGGPPFWGWRKPVQVLELRLVRAHSGRGGIGGLGGCVLEAQCRERREGEEERELLSACVCRA